MTTQNKIDEALNILIGIGMPRGQRNERSALTLLALANISPEKSWSEAERPLMGITPIMDWCRDHYDKDYAPNTRETVRRQTMHQFVEAGIAILNPDKPERPTNSPKTVYGLSESFVKLIQLYEKAAWPQTLEEFLSTQKSLVEKYAKRRHQHLIPVQISEGYQIQMSPGKHSELMKKIVEDFGPRFAPGAQLVYIGDTGDKWGYFDEKLLKELGVIVSSHGKMPDVVLYDGERKWLLLIEAVTSHGPVDAKRHGELATLFSKTKVGVVYVTAFPTKTILAKYISEISWETEVWVADNPSHLIHFDGERFLGPYST